jgi:hypothetical protein
MSGESIAKRYDSGGTSGGVSFPLSASSGSTRLITASRLPGLPIPARVLRNDSGVLDWGFFTHDADGDGLGYELEAALGTCPSIFGTAVGPDGVSYACSNSADARDTDGDALRDDWEVRGDRNANGHAPLPLWGANPRRKDLFVEVDFAQSDAAMGATHKVSPESARSFVRHFADRYRALSVAEYNAHADVMVNPDGTVGIAAHLDIGTAPTNAGELTHFGDWGGYSVVPATAEGTERPASQAWPTHMAAARHKAFR